MTAFRAGVATVLFCASSALRAENLVIPVAGRWRGTESTLTITNVANAPASVQITFVPSSDFNAAPNPLVLKVGPSQTTDIDVGRVILENAASVGGLFVRSEGALDARVRLFDRSVPDARGGMFPAIAASDSIGVGESTLIDVPALGEDGLRLFVVETRQFPLYFSVSIIDGAANRTAARRYYIGGCRQSTHAIETDLPIDRSQPFRLELHGINGSGRIVAAAAAVARDKSITAFEMTRRDGLRHHMTPYEMLAYAFAAVAIAAGALKWRLTHRGSRA